MIDHRLLIVCGALALGGCIVTSEQGRQMQRDIDALRRQTVRLKRLHEESNARMLARMTMLTKRTEELGQRLDTLDLSAHRGTANVGLEVAQLKREIVSLRGDIEVQGFKLQQLDKKIVEPPKETPAVAAKQPTEESPKGAASPSFIKAAAKPPEKSTPKPPKGRNELLEEAKKQLLGKKYDEALATYQKVSSRWKNVAGVTDRAHLGACLAYSGLGDHRKAIVECNRIYEHFPKSQYVDDALWQIAQSFVDLKYPEDARAFLEELILRHPQSPFAAKARSLMKTLQK